jgi:hypothetical protein
VWLHSEDPFRPSDLLEHIRHTTPELDYEPVPDLPPLDLDNLELLNELAPPRKVALTSNVNVTSPPDWFFGKTPDASGKIENVTACVVILVEKSDVELDAFYFYFYSYDRGPNITQVLEPLNGIFGKDVPGYTFGDHVGDWEHNMIRFKDEKPTGIYYSQHRDGTSYKWDDAAISKTGGRPLVYSAYGSHANYPAQGEQIHDSALFDWCDAGISWDPVQSAYFYQLAPETYQLQRLFVPELNQSTSTNFTSFLYYHGIWGDEQYPDDNPIQKTTPKFGLKRFVSGPTGPLSKPLIRKGLGPDLKRVLTWTEWSVDWFMYWYPCCIRGWRKWFSVAAIVGFFVLVGYGVYRSRKWWKTRHYKRVDTEIPLEEMGQIDREDRNPQTSFPVMGLDRQQR